jgi:hypothetical protein
MIDFQYFSGALADNDGEILGLSLAERSLQYSY